MPKNLKTIAIHYVAYGCTEETKCPVGRKLNDLVFEIFCEFNLFLKG